MVEYFDGLGVFMDVSLSFFWQNSFVSGSTADGVWPPRVEEIWSGPRTYLEVNKPQAGANSLRLRPGIGAEDTSEIIYTVNKTKRGDQASKKTFPPEVSYS